MTICVIKTPTFDTPAISAWLYKHMESETKHFIDSSACSSLENLRSLVPINTTQFILPSDASNELIGMLVRGFPKATVMLMYSEHKPGDEVTVNPRIIAQSLRNAPTNVTVTSCPIFGISHDLGEPGPRHAFSMPSYLSAYRRDERFYTIGEDEEANAHELQESSQTCRPN